MQDLLVDTYVHLCAPVFRDDLEDVLAREKGLSRSGLISLVASQSGTFGEPLKKTELLGGCE